MKSDLFNKKDLDRYKSHQKNFYPNEKSYQKVNKLTSYTKKIYSAPTVVNMEITEACNVKCRHCYNPWRDEHAGKFNLDFKKIDYLVNEFDKNKVFHVILSGGEPLAKFKELKYFLKNLKEKNISVSLNSNLMLATEEKMNELKDLGLDHCLTSWFSYFPTETDYITTYSGSYKKIVDGIKTTVKCGIRVSANTIVTQHNKNTIYNSGKFLHEIGVSQFFAHRVIPPAYDRDDKEKQHYVTIEQAKETLDELLRLKNDTGISVGTLISYPLCMLGDLEKYKDFVGRGCPTQSGHRFSLNANGDTHGCVMEDKVYGNVFDIGLKEAYAKTKAWRDESYLFDGCKGCHYIDVCQSGCRMHGYSASGKMNGKDPLMPGKEFIVKPFKLNFSAEAVNQIKSGAKLQVPKTTRFRKEDGFYLLNIRWGNSIELSTEEGDFLYKCFENNKKFSISEFNFGSNPLQRLANLFHKEALISDEIKLKIPKKGVSVDPAKLPDLGDKSFTKSHPNIEI
jgi:radical SAM protein with 4Fe4S-binding SPASM domain